MAWPEAPQLRRPRILRQRWLDLTFVHWALDPAAVAHFFPPGTRPDTFEGRTYVGLVPFRMAGTGFPHGPVLMPTFLETNVRLYSVDLTGRRGVVFLSLDADRPDVVAAARSVFGLPYRWARMTHTRDGNHHTYTSSVRRPIVDAEVTVGVETGPRTTVGPLEDFLTARWGLHVERFGRTWYLPNHHPPWILQTAQLTSLHADSLLRSVGLTPPDRPPDHVGFSPGVPAEFGLPLSS